MKQKLKPCDCKETASRYNEQGIGHNDDSITVDPNVVVSENTQDADFDIDKQASIISLANDMFKGSQ